jgi:hypothetical protein
MIIGKEQHPYKITNVHKIENMKRGYWSDFTKKIDRCAKIDTLFSPPSLCYSHFHFHMTHIPLLHFYLIILLYN